MTPELLLNVLVTVVCFVLSMTVHEWAHAWVAVRLGDRTPETDGRLTLNPVAHVDPLGTLLIPAIGAALGGGLIGWARPVAFRPERFRRSITMSRGWFLVAGAGPLSNVVLAVVCALLLKASVLGAAALDGGAAQGLASLSLFLQKGVLVNVALVVFNLLPVPPLDGFRMLQATIGAHNPVLAWLERNQLLAFVIMILVAYRLLGPVVVAGYSGLLGLVGLG